MKPDILDAVARADDEAVSVLALAHATEKRYLVYRVAQILGKSPQHVRSLCRSGKLRAIKTGPRSWMIPESSVKSYLDAYNF